MTVHARLLTVRKDARLTQADFASALKISRAAYMNYERGDRELPSSLILDLHASFLIDPTWLLTGEGSRTPELKKEMIIAAVSAVHSFALDKNLEILPADIAKLVLLLVEYFEQVGEVDTKFAEKMLELQS